MLNTAAAKALLSYQLDGNAAKMLSINNIIFDVRIRAKSGTHPTVRTVFPIEIIK